jgi:hypothetical protein
MQDHHPFKYVTAWYESCLSRSNHFKGQISDAISPYLSKKINANIQ